jgi:hypothetical protein
MKKTLDTYLSDRDTFFESRSQLNSLIISHYYHDQKRLYTNFENHIRDIIDFSEKFSIESREANNLTSYSFNIFEIFGVGETMHSYLLGHLLNPYSNHGQGHLFLNIFLDLLKIKRFGDKENWIVTTEKGKIDILLKRNTPHSVIIIENKSNYAIDQENQLYRYWYQEIYTTIKSKNLPNDYILNPPNDLYKVIYLSPDYLKRPNENSILKPYNWDENLPSYVPLEVEQVVFSDFITNWLDLSLTKISSDNHRMKEHIKQYIEYWTI